ncbi:MAG: NADH:flavin oxidoreductase/NADH oxidase [Candidatus Obscuribacterales bacterium]|nr:NADH:flavin oxidoreductase/NADH oxidase [Candidatus Obscuribacterales bacterium]
MPAQYNLFSPLTIRSVTLPNRVAVSPMCQYSSEDGKATDWHLVHLGSRAVGGAGMVMVEATAVEARGRISPADMGIWDDMHIEPLARVAKFITEQGSVPAIQIAHAGRKASTPVPWEGNTPLSPNNGGWQTIGPSAIPFSEQYSTPQELSLEGINTIKKAFVAAAKRSTKAGFKIIEIHSAHGYLLHSFLSPLSNQRTDSYGGGLQDRMRLLLEIATEIRQVIPADMPLFTRISATDWADGGWNIDEAVLLAKELKDRGVDLVDCSSGGLVSYAKVPVEPGYQVPFAERIRHEAKILTGAVGLITTAQQADDIIKDGKADLVLLAREMLRDPYWPLHAASTLKQKGNWPKQYLRAT